jgi:protocatechuate 3,4-dioxygenase beta subunit
MKTSQPTMISRRDALRSLTIALGGATLYACSGGGGVLDDGTGTSSEEADSGSSTTTTTTTGDSGSTAWATGGTKSMTAQASYPDPFTMASAACALLVTATEGPCTEAADQVRKDISEGYAGLPVRLALKVVDESCNPIADAKVKIWHTQVNGSYSGNTPNNGMCLKDQTDSAKHYFRGAQTTDANGRVDFDTCFPGWYRGRAVHIHFTVTHGGKSFTSQIGFDQDVIAEIFGGHAEYASFGQPDTPNATDNILGGAKLETYMAQTERMTDGAMLASKMLIVNI